MLTNNETVSASYLKAILWNQGLKKTVSLMAQALKPYSHLFDTIAFRGVSGDLLGPSLALKMGKEMLVVRKQPSAEDASHSWRSVEGNSECKGYIVVDDIVASGNTVAKIIQMINEKDDFMYGIPKFVGVCTFFQIFSIPALTSYDWSDEYSAVARIFKQCHHKDFFAIDVNKKLEKWLHTRKSARPCESSE